MSNKRFLTIMLFIMAVSALILTSCSNELQVQEELEQDTQNAEIQTEDALVDEQIDELLLDENEDVQTEDVLGDDVTENTSLKEDEDVQVENTLDDDVVIEEVDDFLLDEDEDINLGEVI